MSRTVPITRAGQTQPDLVEGVVLIDRATGEPIPTSALGGVTLAELLASVLPVAPNVTRGGGAIDANTQRVTLATDGPGVAALASIDAKTPALVSSVQPVIATPRTCLGMVQLSITTTAQTLPALAMAGGIAAGIPAGAVVCELQADGGTVRVSRVGSITPTTTLGYRLDDGAVLVVDSTLAECQAFCSKAILSTATSDPTTP